MYKNANQIKYKLDITVTLLAQNHYDNAKEILQEIIENENIVARAFRNKALRVEHDRLQATGIVRLNFRENVVQVIERLNRRINRVGMIARGGHGHNFQAPCVNFLGIQRNRRGNNYDLRLFATVRVEP